MPSPTPGCSGPTRLPSGGRSSRATRSRRTTDSGGGRDAWARVEGCRRPPRLHARGPLPARDPPAPDVRSPGHGARPRPDGAGEEAPAARQRRGRSGTTSAGSRLARSGVAPRSGSGAPSCRPRWRSASPGPGSASWVRSSGSSRRASCAAGSPCRGAPPPACSCRRCPGCPSGGTARAAAHHVDVETFVFARWRRPPRRPGRHRRPTPASPTASSPRSSRATACSPGSPTGGRRRRSSGCSASSSTRVGPSICSTVTSMPGPGRCRSSPRPPASRSS